MTDCRPELLAPAGSRAAFEAALGAGADAIYLGLDGFNARRGADNFTLEDLSAACRDAHLRGRRVYLTANTLVFPGEMDEAFSLVESAAEAGIDAVIVQDVGLISVIARHLPELRIHASTQMNIRDAAGLRLARQLGACRVTLARELSLEQIAALADEGVELECFVHGALCVCQSGQCLFSSMVGGRSANRGLCAQPCRLPYEMRDTRGKRIATDGDYLLSPRDLCTLEVLPQLVGTGISSLKIEGRMKSPDYVSTVVGVYRAALDRALAAPDAYEVDPDELRSLEEAFSRGFSTGYLQEHDGDELMGYTRPNNRGTLVGRVSGFSGGLVQVKTNTPLAVGDLLEFWTSGNRVTHTVTQADDIADTTVGLVVDGQVAISDRVFRVRSTDVGDAVRERTERGLQIPLDFSVRMLEGNPLEIGVVDERGIEASVQGDVVEAARTKVISEAEVIEHVGRLGNTPYTARNFTVELSDGVGIAFSQLHRLRSEALQAYEEAALDAYGRERRRQTPTHGRVCYEKSGPADCGSTFDTAINWYDTSIATTLADFAPGVQIGPRLYATNVEALQTWAELGADFAWLSPELTLDQIQDLAAASPLPLGIIVGGRTELMVSDHCFLRAQGPCDHDCVHCARRGVGTVLKDRKGYEFPVATDQTGRGHLYNAVPLDTVHAVGDLKRAGVVGFAIDTTLMGDGEAKEELDRLRSALKGKPVTKKDGATTGHLFRKVD